jgi:hypothetical protein
VGTCPGHYDTFIQCTYTHIHDINTPLRVEAESSRRLYLDFSVSRSPEDGTVTLAIVCAVNDVTRPSKTQYLEAGGHYGK